MRGGAWLIASACSATAPTEEPRPAPASPAVAGVSAEPRPEPSGPAADPACPPCEGATSVGPAWAYAARGSAATKLGTDDKDTHVDVFAVQGECCRPHQSHRFEPGWRVIGADPARGVIVLQGHDARWGAYAADGIVELELRSGERRVLASHVLQEIPCESGGTRVSALVTRTDRDPGDELDAGAFHLEVLELRPPSGSAPVLHRVATSPFFARLYPDHDEHADELLRAHFGWSSDCRRLTWARGPGLAKSPPVFSLPQTQ